MKESQDWSFSFQMTSIFGSDDDDDNDCDANRMMIKTTGSKASLSSTMHQSKKINVRDKLAYENALDQDPSIFDYDSHISDVKPQNSGTARSSDAKKRPKYMNQMLNASARRKLENERHIERKIQREYELSRQSNEAESEEQFVTSAYTKKLEEFEILDKLERAEDSEEAKLSAESKQLSDIGKYYLSKRFDDRNICEEKKSGEESKNIDNENDAKEVESDTSRFDKNYSDKKQYVKDSRKKERIVVIEEETKEEKEEAAKKSIMEKFAKKVKYEDLEEKKENYLQRKANLLEGLIDSEDDE
ncbi:MAG: Nuclear speckle splicing regulatory protein 1 [Marteilia pararefringens]